MNIEEGDNADDGRDLVDYELDGAVYVLQSIRPSVYRGISGGPGQEPADIVAPYPLKGLALASVRACGEDHAAFLAAMTTAYPFWFPPLAARWGHALHSLIVGQPGTLPAL